MKIERTKNTIRNTFYGTLANFISILLPFVIRTLFIKTIGIEYLGLNSLFTSILNILNLSELGISSAIVFSMYKPIAEDDCETICALMSLYKRLYRGIGLIVLIVGLCFVPFLERLINGDIPGDINIYLLYLIFLANTVITYWMFAYKTCLLTAHQRVDIISKVQILCNCLMYLGQILVLLFFKNYYLYVVLLPISTVAINICNNYFASKMFPSYKPKGVVSKKLSGEIKKRVVGLMFDKVAMASRNAFDSIVISLFLGLTEVAIYNNYYYIVTAVSGFLTVFLNGIAAGIGNSLACESREKNEADMRSINFVFMSIVGLCFSFLINLYQPFMKLWVGENIMFPELTMIAFSLFFLFQKSESIIGRYYDAAGLWWVGRWKGPAEALVNIFLNFSLGYFFGSLGVISATIISVLFVALPMETFFTYKYYYKKSFGGFLVEQISTLFMLSAIGIFSHLLVIFFDNIVQFNNLFLVLVMNACLTLTIFIFLYIIIFGRIKRFRISITWIRSHGKLLRIRR